LPFESLYGYRKKDDSESEAVKKTRIRRGRGGSGSCESVLPFVENVGGMDGG